MSDEPLIDLISAGVDPLIDVIFVHGLTGDAHETWRINSKELFWPQALQKDLDRVSVFTLGYPTSLFEKLAKKEMNVFERAANLLELLAGHGIGNRPIVFVTHSLGGILTKLLLRKSLDASDSDWKRISESTRLVVFLSTPHSGSALAKVLSVVPFTSNQIKLLADHTGFLSELNDDYRNFADGREDLVTAVYYEKHLTNKTAVVVTRDDADPGVSGATPVAVDKDHINICKPRDQDDIIYRAVRRHVQKTLRSVEKHSSDSQDFLWETDDYAERHVEDRRDLLEKLIEAQREHEYPYANAAQNHFAREYTKTGLFTVAREQHDDLLSEVEARFISHVYHPLICRSAPDSEIQKAIQEMVIDPLLDRKSSGKALTSKTIRRALYFLTEQCYVRWDAPS